MVPDDSFVDGFLHEHAELAQGAVLERFLGIEFDVLHAPIAPASNLRVELEELVDELDELLPF